MVVSACLGGESVRWDGSHARRDFVADVLSRHVDVTSVCPEVEMGLPVPREPIQLVRTAAGFDVFGVESKRDFTTTLADWARRRAAELATLDPDAFILKSRSPSCGLDGARVFETMNDLVADDGPWVRGGRGLFAAVIVEAFPDVPIVDEESLATRDGQLRFVTRMAERREAGDTALAALLNDIRGD